MKNNIALFLFFLSCFYTVYGERKTKQTKMKILFVVDKFPWFTKVVILNQVMGLLDRKHDVHVYADSGMKPYEVSDVVKKYNLYKRTYYQELPPNLESFDLIVCQYGTLAKPWIKLKKTHNLKAKFVVFYRGGDVSTDRHVRRYECDEVFDQADLILPICDYFKYLLMRLGCNPNKIFVQYSGVDCERFAQKVQTFKSSGCLRIISVNRLFEEKATLDVLKALNILVKKHKNVYYTIVGDGADRGKIEKFIRENKLDDYVDLVGWVNHDELTKFLYKSDVFVLPSVISRRGSEEAIPNAIKEAMLMGLPVVVTYHGGNTELICDKVNGLLVPERDVDSLVDAFCYLINNPTCWSSLIENGRKKVKEMFCMHKLNSLLEKRFYKLLDW